MDLQVLIKISVFLPTLVLIFFLVTNRIPPATRRIFLFAVPIMFVVDIFVLYKFILPSNSEVSQEPAESRATQLLAKYPVEAQSFAFTRTCQAWHIDLLKDRGLSQEALNSATLPVCTCVSAQLMTKSEFNEIEQMANKGEAFFSIVATHKNLLNSVMKTCADDLEQKK